MLMTEALKVTILLATIALIELGEELASSSTKISP